MISLGSILGGGELAGSKADRLIRRFCAALPSDQDGTDANINIVFHVPGSIAKPDYVGIRTGRYSTKQNTLMIQVAVPDALIHSPELESFIHSSLVEAIAKSKEFFQFKEMEFNERDYLNVLRQMKQQLSSGVVDEP